MPYRQVGDKIDWITASKPILISSTTTAYVAYNIGANIPMSILKRLLLTNKYSGTQLFSYDGITDCDKLHSTGTLVEIIAVDSLYAKHDPSSYPVYATSITLRR